MTGQTPAMPELPELDIVRDLTGAGFAAALTGARFE
jgi:hypothetical protein